MAEADNASDTEQEQADDSREESRPRGKAEGKGDRDKSSSGGGDKKRMNGRRAARRAALHLAELTGKQFEGIVGIRKSEDGWCVEVEVLEMSRIPSTTDVLATFEVTLDGSGELVGYHRVARYVRGDAGERG
jgi:hypothetical protein